MQRRELLKTIALGTGALGTGLMQPSGLRADAAAASASESAVEKNGVKFWLENSLTRVYPNSPVGSAAIPALTTARNARLSFQACFRNLKDCSIRVRATVEGADDLRSASAARRLRAAAAVEHRCAARRTGWRRPCAGLGARPALSRTDGPRRPGGERHILDHALDTCRRESWRARNSRAAHGRRHVSLSRLDRRKTRERASCPCASNVRPLVLQKRKDFPATNWISADSIWEYYKIEPFSERFWQLADAYIKNLTDHNFNTIYSPIFNARHEILKRPGPTAARSPRCRRQVRVRLQRRAPVDRPRAEARRRARRVDALLHARSDERPVSAAHLRTLGQARPAAVAAGDQRRLADLSQVSRAVPAAVQVGARRRRRCSSARSSTAPTSRTATCRWPTTARPARMLRELAPWMKVIDAMSEPRFATEGLSDMPIPSIATALLFREAKCPAWVYFCCGPRGRFLQRLHDTPLAKLRMAGWLFYKLDAKGFLHWGHNYWFKFCTERDRRPVPRPRRRRVARAAVRRSVCRLPRRRWPDRFDPLGSLRRIAAGLRDAAIGRHQPRRPDARRAQELRRFSEERSSGSKPPFKKSCRNGGRGPVEKWAGRNLRWAVSEIRLVLSLVTIFERPASLRTGLVSSSITAVLVSPEHD